VGHEPSPRVAADDGLGQQPFPRRGSGTRRARVDQRRGQPSGTDVLVSQPAQRFFPYARRLVLGQALPGEVPQQVMQPVPDQPGGVDPGAIDEHRVHQMLEQFLGVIGVRPGQRGQVPGREIGGQQAEQAEGVLLRLGSAVITETERGTHFQISRFQQILVFRSFGVPG